MKIFRLPPRPKGMHQEETRLQSVVRWSIILILFAGVLWGFWINSERQMARMQKAQHQRMDATGLLSEANERQLSVYADRFRKVYGLSLIISIRKAPFASSYIEDAEKAGVMVLGLRPAAREVVFLVPPLAASVLGQSFIDHMRNEHFSPYFDAGNWPEGLAAALNLLAARLDASLNKEPDGSGLPFGKIPSHP